MMLLTAAPFNVQPLNMSFAPRCAARRGDKRGGSRGGCGRVDKKGKAGAAASVDVGLGCWEWGGDKKRHCRKRE